MARALILSHTRPHPIKNKLQHAVRHSVLWHPRILINKKRESKKRGLWFKSG